MKTNSSTFIIYSILLSLQLSIQQIPYEIEPIKAPFKIPQLERPVFSEFTINIIKTGAKQNKLSTPSIQKAIDQLYNKGGGTLIIPSGKCLIGRIELKSNINLKLEEGQNFISVVKLKIIYLVYQVEMRV